MTRSREGGSNEITEEARREADRRNEMKTWYSAHVIMFAEFKDGPQEHFPVWENVVLIEAESEESAFEKAERHG